MKKKLLAILLASMMATNATIGDYYVGSDGVWVK